jgi:isoleucyl-tRNA synthetase
MNQFYDLYLLNKKIFEKTDTEAQVSVLAWTTTPWTLPSNMFAAVGKHIHYCIVYDPGAKEYFILAENLIKQYYRDANEYVLINIIQGEDLVGLSYEPLFQHINQSKISQKYKDQFFKIIAGEFVSTEDGTGIVHIAPSFGVEDFEAVAQFLPREEAKKWLFLPINEYGEFTDEVPEWKGMRVYDANKDVIQKLKDEKKLIGQRSYNHSYPHCRRCDTPLVSKAVTSWFIKEPELNPITVPHAEKIGFVPEAIKNRFSDVLQSAPDRNLSRNRYRGSPLPIREAVTSKE